MKKILWVGLSVGLLWLGLFAPMVYATTTVKAIRTSNNDTQTRVVFDLSQKVAYQISTLTKPDRVVVDLADAKTAITEDHLHFSGGVIKRLRHSQEKSGLRFVFDVTAPVTPKVFLLAANGNYGERLVLDFPKSARVTTSTPAPQIKVSTKPRKLRDIVVVIDPGHGGKDPGAHGPKGTLEKHVVLAISQALRKQIDATPGYKAVLTREGDTYIPLRRRLGITRDYHGDVFLSIHADAFKNARARGASVFALSERGASSEAARWLAEKENYSELGGVDLNDKSNVLRSVLLDLSQTATVAASVNMGALVLNQIGRFAKLHSDDVEQAGFVVLKSPDIPSILVETGFISNPGEEKKLRSRAYQNRLAAAIATGVRQYFNERAPEGTYVYASRRERRYVVRSGDTLSGLAQQFGVSMSDLQRANGLSSHVLKIGQPLLIPAAS